VTWSANQNAFGDVSINGTTVTVRVISQSGSTLYTRSFSHGAPAPTPTPAGGTFGSATYVSTAAYDGYVLESSETSGLGNYVNSTGTVFRVGDDGSNRQYRGFLSFSTAGLPDNAVLSSVTLKITQAGMGGASPYSSLGSLLVDIKTGTFSGSSSLQSADFQAASSRNGVMSVPNAPSSGWYSSAMSSSSFGYINKTGITQLRLRFSTDDNNNHVADYLSFYTGDTSTTGSRPMLIIRYTVP
jgi:hypothetical protein